MGVIYLDGRTPGYKPLDQVIRDAGLVLHLWNGWENNTRSSGGFESLLGTVLHHTAGSATGSFENDWAYHAVGHADAPVANMLLGRQGQVGLHAGGASNHAGKGGPWQASKGLVPLDSANSRMLGIEAQNTGTGEYWPEQMVDCYERLLAAINNAYGFDPMRDEPAHFQWAPSRKIDPWGGNQSTVGYPYTGPHSWTMSGFNENVLARMAGGGTPGDDMVPVLQYIVPIVDGVPNPAQFVRYSSGHLVWASNAEAIWCSQNGVPNTPIAMGSDQYQRLINEALGFPDQTALAASASKSDPEPAGA